MSVSGWIVSKLSIAQADGKSKDHPNGLVHAELDGDKVRMQVYVPVDLAEVKNQDDILESIKASLSRKGKTKLVRSIKKRRVASKA